MRLLLVVSFALGLACSNALGDQNNETSSRSNTGSKPSDADDKLIRRVEEQMLTLNKSNEAFRDKRALGILLQGFMEALGYTVAPIQLGSLPIAQAPAAAGMAAPQMPAPAQPMNLQGGPMPPPQGNPIPAPPPANATASASTPPRQRETLRFTGVLNFGNNSNTTNLIDHLTQYERIFHGGATPQPPAAPTPSIDPRALPPLPEPLFVKIPLPIVPNLPPPQPPSPMPVQNTYHDGYHQQQQQQNQEEEYRGSEDDEGQKGNFEEEDDEAHHHEEYEHSHEELSEPEVEDEEAEEEAEEGHAKYHEEPKERKYEAVVSHDKPAEKNRETHYKKNQHVENYSVENKEIRDPSEVSEEVPIVGSKYGHTMYVGEPDWKQQQEDHVYRLAAEQEARAEALAEENAERERSRSSEHEEESAERNEAREKEISENNEKHGARFEAASREQPNPYYDDVKEKYNNAAELDYEEETETRHRESPANAPPPRKVGVTEMAASRRYEEKPGKNSSREDYQEAEQSEPPQPTLPISYDREGSAQRQPLRDSYGESLEKPGGKVDDRVADYITMFKNPQTGVYEPGSLQQYGKARVPYDRLDLLSGFKKIQQEYGRPGSKYEEYEINEEDDSASGGEGSKAEHREGAGGSEEREQHSKEASTECNCSPRKNDALSEEAQIPERPATARLPTATPTPLAALDYGPYFSTVRHLYEPTSDEQGIIARLTSYGPPTTARLEAAPTVLALPEKLTASSLLQQSETKEITAWPAPFDYVFDNSEHRSTVLKSPPTRRTPLQLGKPDCHREALASPPGKRVDRKRVLTRQHERGSGLATESTKKRKRRPQSFKDRPAEQVGQHSNDKLSYRQTVESTQASHSKQRKPPLPATKSESWTEQIKAPTVPSNVLEPPIAPVHGPVDRTTKAPAEKAKSSRQQRGNQQTSRPRATAKKKHAAFSINRPIPLAGGNTEEERSNYVEKDGILIVPEPTPYYYNENIEEFTDEPHSDTEKIKIKEIRNRVASVKVSQLNQLHPDSSMQIFKYLRNLSR